MSETENLDARALPHHARAATDQDVQHTAIALLEDWIRDVPKQSVSV